MSFEEKLVWKLNFLIILLLRIKLNLIKLKFKLSNELYFLFLEIKEFVNKLLLWIVFNKDKLLILLNFLLFLI